MGIKKIFLTLFLLATFLIPVAFAQAAACTIREERTSGIAGVANTPACSAKLGETKSDDSKCQNIKPTIRYGAGGETIREVCCCTKESGAAVVSTVPKFKVPELQIELPGLKFTQPNCAQGENGEYTCEVNWLGEYITWIYNYALKIAGILAAVMLMAGGLLWLVSAGDAAPVQ